MSQRNQVSENCQLAPVARDAPSEGARLEALSLSFIRLTGSP